MKKINIKKDNKIVQHAIFKDDETMNTWLALLNKDHAWGKPERWVKADEEDVSLALEQRVIQAEFETYTEYKLASQFEIEVIDITSEVEAEKTAKAAKEAKKTELAALKGKSLTTDEIKTAVELLIEIWPT